jgi:hypothetical protein
MASHGAAELREAARALAEAAREAGVEPRALSAEPLHEEDSRELDEPLAEAA